MEIVARRVENPMIWPSLLLISTIVGSPLKNTLLLLPGFTYNRIANLINTCAVRYGNTF